MSTKFFEVNSDKHKFLFCVKVKFQYLRGLIPFTSVRVLKRDWFANTNSLAVTLARGAVYLIFLQIFYPLQKVRTSDKRRSWLSDRWDSAMQKQIQFPNPRCHFGRERERECMRKSAVVAGAVCLNQNRVTTRILNKRTPSTFCTTSSYWRTSNSHLLKAS